MKDLLGATDPAHTPLWKKITAGAVSGAFGSALANPTDLVKVRMQAEGKLEAGQARRYKNTLDAFMSIYHKEGFAGLYRVHCGSMVIFLGNWTNDIQSITFVGFFHWIDCLELRHSYLHMITRSILY